MLSRRNRIQEKKATRKGLYLLLASLALLAILAVFGVQLLVQGAGFVSQFKTPTQALNSDKTPPGPPQLDPFPPSYTKDSPVTLNGRAEANSTAQIYANGEKVKDIQVNESGRFVFDIPLKEGLNNVYLVTTDQAGNISPESGTYPIIYDNSPPPVDITKPQEGATFYAPEQTISVEGKTDREAQVTINERLAIVSSDGSFSLKLKLENGENVIKIMAKDKAENLTEKEIRVTFNQ